MDWIKDNRQGGVSWFLCDPVTDLRVWEVFEVVLVGTARTIQVMPLLEDYREFFDFSPDWPG